jgi:hypothetical protein
MRTDNLQTLLIRRGILSSDQIGDAVLDSRGSGGTWIEHLVLQGVVDEDGLAGWFSEEIKVPRAALPVLANLVPSVLQHLPREVSVEHRMMPLELDQDGYLHVAMVDPSDDVALMEAGFFAGRPLQRQVASATAIAWALLRYHGAETMLWPRQALVRRRAVGA